MQTKSVWLCSILTFLSNSWDSGQPTQEEDGCFFCDRIAMKRYIEKYFRGIKFLSTEKSTNEDDWIRMHLLSQIIWMKCLLRCIHRIVCATVSKDMTVKVPSTHHSAKQLAAFWPKQNWIEDGCNSSLKFAAIHQKLLQSESGNGTI